MYIINACVYTMENDRVLENGYVRLENGKIADCGEMSGLLLADEAVFDAQGGSVVPGFIDAHCHIGIGPEASGSENIEYFESRDPIVPHYRGIDAIYLFDTAFQKAISAGVTLAVAGPGSTALIDGQLVAFKLAGNTMRDMCVMAPCAMKLAVGETPKAAFDKTHSVPITRMATARLLRETFRAARTYWEQKNAGVSVPYNAKYEALIPVLTREIPLHVHSYRTDDMLMISQMALDFGFRCILVHGNESDEIADILAARGVGVILGPMIRSRYSASARELSFEIPKRLHDAGVLFALCTDHCQNRMVSIEFLPVYASLSARYGLSDLEALASITIDSARLLGIDDRVGSIRAGKDGDIAVFNGHPLDFRSRTTAVFINGRRVK